MCAGASKDERVSTGATFNDKKRQGKFFVVLLKTMSHPLISKKERPDHYESFVCAAPCTSDFLYLISYSKVGKLQE